jgi:DNA-binding NarL/FixJ family response regulator
MPISVGILLVRNQELLADAIAVVLALDRELRIAAVETDAGAGPSRILAAGPDVVLVDDIPLVAQLREMRPTVRVIVLGADNDPGVALACVQVGAAGCVGDSTTAGALAGLIKAVHGGQLLYDPRVLVSLLQRPHLPIIPAPQRTAKLGDREVEVLEVLAQGLASLEAAEQLGISVHTLRTHTKNIVAKLAARSKLEAVLIAIREGRIRLPLDVSRPDTSA